MNMKRMRSIIRQQLKHLKESRMKKYEEIYQSYMSYDVQIGVFLYHKEC